MLEVLILAAGRGWRLRPLTDSTPKALLQVGAESLIERHLRRLAAQGFGEVVINLAWLGEQIRAQLGDGRRFGLRIRYSEEPAGALETGGGIARALRQLRGDPFLVINADILCDFDFASLGVTEADDMQLALVENPRGDSNDASAGGDFALRDGRLLLPGGDAQTWTYAGIGCFRRRAFDAFDATAAARFPLLPVIERAITGGRAGGQIHRGQWLDVGTPERLAEARRRAGEPRR
ncbi:MAG: nucleotidyltransferase family protein [Gammaproteobacteria bacterium]|nr:nucleotidyltransferase family protein [Gammaproteobacteria bacterium]